MSLVTTLPAPTNAYSPIVCPATIVELAPIDAPFLIKVFKNKSGYILERGTLSLVKVTLGPMKTLSSKVTPSHN